MRTINLIALVLLALAARPQSVRADSPAAEPYHKKIQPLLSNYCYDCHGEGAKKGKVTLDEFASEQALFDNRELWLKVLKNVRAGIMPPAKEQQPTPEEKAELEQWIKYTIFGLDPANPDPGRVTLRRLNRVEYRNTIRDLMGIEFKADEEFPPDDTGYGFDNIGDVLTVSPLLLEKYMQAAETIVAKAVPTEARVVREETIAGPRFKRDDTFKAPEPPKPSAEELAKLLERKRDSTDVNAAANRANRRDPNALSFYEPARVVYTHKVETAGSYKVVVELNVRGEFDFDAGRCRFKFKLDDNDLLNQEFGWANGKTHTFEYDVKWEPGEKKMAFELEPLTPVELRDGGVDMRVASVQVKGPTEPQHWARPKNFERFFTRDAPDDKDGRRQYAREVLSTFARKAFRRPVDDRTLDRLVAIAEDGYGEPGKNFQQGVSRAMVAVLASPRFVFRPEEPAASASPGDDHPQLDEYALAARLSYFFWSTMPDEELSRLADKGELRKNLSAQVKRMLADGRSKQFVENFVGQWLQVRDVEGISINERSVLARDEGQDRQLQRQQEERRALFARLEGLPEAERQKELAKLRQQFRGNNRAPRVQLDQRLRQAMKRESEMLFEHVMREDRSVLDFLDSDYTFLNERLAKLYGVPGVEGDEMRRVELPKDSPRGGVLTQGAVLVVTSNPTRTSPVKRGVFVLDNILGSPTPPPPADVPDLEDSEKGVKGHEPTTAEILAIHRGKPLCASCHNRMDPLGLSLENFNALGMWREQERKQKLEVAGTLITGESFEDIRGLKKVLRDSRRDDFYQCLTEKMLTYALGRGLDYHDIETVDQIAARLKKEDGKFSALVAGIVESAAFQKMRKPATDQSAPEQPKPAQQASTGG